MLAPSPDPIAEVVALWNGGQSLAEIGRSLHITQSRVANLLAQARRRNMDVRKGRAHDPMVQAEKARAAKKRGCKSEGAPAPSADPVVEIPPGPAAVTDAVAGGKVPSARPRPQPHPDATPRTLMNAPQGTCRVVVGRSERGANLYCCGPVPSGRKVWCCELHTRFIFASGPSAQAGAIARTDFALKHLGAR